jgi:hypothetical protein
MSRFPLVLGAAVSSYHPDRQSPLFGIFSLWKFFSLDRNLTFDIGPNETWFQSAREYRLLTNEALRTLRSEFPKETLADRLLRAVPEFSGRQLLTSSSPHSWVEGRHPQEPWVWYFPDVFRVLDDPTPPSTSAPPASEQQAEGETPKADRSKRIPLAEAEVRVREWLKKYAKRNPAAITRDMVAVGADVSTASVSRTAAWQAFRQKRDAKAKPRVREVPLTRGMLSVLKGDDGRDAELAALIEEQRADMAEETRYRKFRT